MACMNRAWAIALVALMGTGLAACGSRGGDRAAPAAGSVTTAAAAAADHGERYLSRPPDVGVACPRANSIACDRVGLAVWLERPAERVTATIDGRSLRLRAGRPDRAGYEGYLQPAGLLDGSLKVTPDRGRFYWQGSHPRDARLHIVIRRASGATDRVSLSVPLRPGWG
jgi:hypothetical protein